MFVFGTQFYSVLAYYTFPAWNLYISYQVQAHVPHSEVKLTKMLASW